jgi:hypothetical protein
VNSPDEKQLAEFKAKYGEVYVLSAECGESVVVKKPSRAAYHCWKAERADEAKRVVAVENLLKSCVVAPEAAVLESMLEQQPAIADTFGEDLLRLAGLGRSSAKKA